MRFTFLTIALSLLFLLFFGNTAIADELDDFLKDHAFKVSENTISDRIQFFLDPRYRKRQVFWYAGSLTSSEGALYDKVQLKFNTVSNTVYINHGDHIYSVPSHAVNGFFVFDEGVTRHFQKGYSKTFLHAVSARFSNDALSVMDNISQYEVSGDFRILSVYIAAENPGLTVATIEFSTKSVNKVTGFNNFLNDSEGANLSEIVSVLPEFDESTFLEVKVIGNNGNFLKLNYKDISQSVNMTQIKQDDTNIYNKNSYFIANENQEIFEVQLNKKSIKKGLAFVGLRPNAIPSGATEKQLTAWLKKNL